MGVAAWNPEVGGAGLDDRRGGTEVLELAGIGCRRDERGKSAVGVGAVNVGQQPGAVTDRDRHIVLAGRPVESGGQVAILATCGLRSVQLTLTGLRTGCSYPSHGILISTYTEINGLTVRPAPRYRQEQFPYMLKYLSSTTRAALGGANGDEHGAAAGVLDRGAARLIPAESSAVQALSATSAPR